VGSSPEEPEEHEEPEERVAELVFERDARSLHGALRLLPGAPLPAALLPAGSARSAAASSLGFRCMLIELGGDWEGLVAWCTTPVLPEPSSMPSVYIGTALASATAERCTGERE
jgi:hypothetical protein